MKYPNWESLTDKQKCKIAVYEAELDTHNGTTKDDMVNIIKFLVSRSKDDEMITELVNWRLMIKEIRK